MANEFITKDEFAEMLDEQEKRLREYTTPQKSYTPPEVTQLTAGEYMALPPEEKAKVSAAEKARLLSDG